MSRFKILLFLYFLILHAFWTHQHPEYGCMGHKVLRCLRWNVQIFCRMYIVQHCSLNGILVRNNKNTTITMFQVHCIPGNHHVKTVAWGINWLGVGGIWTRFHMLTWCHRNWSWVSYPYLQQHAYPWKSHVPSLEVFLPLSWGLGTRESGVRDLGTSHTTSKACKHPAGFCSCLWPLNKLNDMVLLCPSCQWLVKFRYSKLGPLPGNLHNPLAIRPSLH